MSGLHRPGVRVNGSVAPQLADHGAEEQRTHRGEGNRRHRTREVGAVRERFHDVVNLTDSGESEEPGGQEYPTFCIASSSVRASRPRRATAPLR